VAREADLIEVQGQPVRKTYHNPHGIPCEVYTFSKAGKLSAGSEAIEAFTWFEGYAWRPVGCAACKTHLGWRYEASEPHLDPQVFFGLLVEALTEKTEPS
jgi:cereblon